LKQYLLKCNKDLKESLQGLKLLLLVVFIIYWGIDHIPNTGSHKYLESFSLPNQQKYSADNPLSTFPSIPLHSILGKALREKSLGHRQKSESLRCANPQS